MPATAEKRSFPPYVPTLLAFLAGGILHYLFTGSPATPLGQSKSEFALSLMKDGSFKDGFMKNLPPGTKVDHKFGEWDNKKDFELHESGILYIRNKAYLLTVMTRVNNREKLPGGDCRDYQNHLRPTH